MVFLVFIVFQNRLELICVLFLKVLELAVSVALILGLGLGFLGFRILLFVVFSLALFFGGGLLGVSLFFGFFFEDDGGVDVKFRLGLGLLLPGLGKSFVPFLFNHNGFVDFVQNLFIIFVVIFFVFF